MFKRFNVLQESNCINCLFQDTFHVSEGKSNSNHTNRASASSSKNLHNTKMKSSAKSSSNQYSANTSNSQQKNSHRHKPYHKYNSLNKR